MNIGDTVEILTAQYEDEVPVGSKGIIVNIMHDIGFPPFVVKFEGFNYEFWGDEIALTGKEGEV